MSAPHQPLPPREQAVCAAVARRSAALLDDLRFHVGLPTGGRGESEALAETRRLLTGRAAALGATLELVPGSPKPHWLYGQDAGVGAAVPPTAICRRPVAGAAAREALLAGHLDTVHDPAGPFRALTIAPGGATATGPGCVDMKGGLVIALHALEALDETGSRLPWTLLLNSDEETGSYHSQRAIHDEAERVAKAGGVGIALEPATADGGLVVERAGSGQFVVECTGRAAHVGRDFAAGVSAVNLLAECVSRLAGLSRPAEGIILNVGPLEGGTATNVVPDRARAWGNVRFPTPEAAADLERRLQAAAADVPCPEGGSITVRTSFVRAAKPLTPAAQRLAELARAVAADLGQSLPFARTAGVCDGNIMQAAGLPTIDTLGVRGGGLHTPQEWIELPSLVERCQLLAVTLLRAGGT